MKNIVGNMIPIALELIDPTKLKAISSDPIPIADDAIRVHRNNV